MSAQRWMFALAAVLVGAAASCSLLVGDLRACGDGLPPCEAGRVCRQDKGYCISEPEGCRRELADAGVLDAYGATAARNAIRVGLLFDFTSGGAGAVDALRLQQLNAVLLAMEEINTRAGIGGRPFSLHVCNTKGNPTLAQSQAAWMADQLDTKALIVSTTGTVVALSSGAISRDVLLMSPMATAQELRVLNNPDGGVRLVWRTAPSDLIQARVIADLLKGTSVYDAGLSGVARVGIAYVDNAYGQEMTVALGDALITAKTLRSTGYVRGGDVDASVAGLDAFNPDVTVLIGAPDDLGRIVTAATTTTNLSRAAGHQWFFADSAKDPAIISLSPPGELEGSHGTTLAQSSGPAYPAFQSRFQRKYGIDPFGMAFIAHSYDAMYALALACGHAVGSSGSDSLTGSRIAEGLGRLETGAAVLVGPTDFTTAREAIQSGGTVNLQGASGQLDFDLATGEAPGAIELWQVSGGAIQSLKVIP